MAIKLQKLFDYLKSYEETEIPNFYFGTDNNLGSVNFLKYVAKTGYKIITKPVKYLTVVFDGKKYQERKCDFDIEISLSVHKYLANNFRTYIFFSGDGDFAPLYEFLLENNKQVVVIYAHGHLGREVYALKKVFKKSIDHFGVDLYRKEG